VLAVGLGREGDADGVTDDGEAVTVVVTTEALGPAVVQAVSSIPATATATALSKPTIRSFTLRRVYSAT
jgi:hypothetical protein